VSLVARHLEANGISTVTFSNARDITESACNPRTVFTNYPLGNACGRPHDRDNQRDVLQTGFRLLEEATAPGIIVDTPFAWSEGDEWRRLVFTHERPWLSEKAEAERRGIIARNRERKQPQE
jgi:hypothetical protein